MKYFLSILLLMSLLLFQACELPKFGKETESLGGDNPSKEETDPVAGNEVGYLCYTLDVPLVNSDEVFNARNSRGKITVINLWGTWCEPCKAELPDFDRIATEYADEVTVVAIHSDYAKDVAPEYVEANFPDSNIFFGIDENDRYYTMLGGQGNYPMTWILNADGVIIAKYVGRVHYDTLKGHIEAELQK